MMQYSVRYISDKLPQQNEKSRFLSAHTGCVQITWLLYILRRLVFLQLLSSRLFWFKLLAFKMINPPDLLVNLWGKKWIWWFASPTIAFCLYKSFFLLIVFIAFKIMTQNRKKTHTDKNTYIVREKKTVFFYFLKSEKMKEKKKKKGLSF